MNNQFFGQTLLRVTACLSLSFVFGCSSDSPTESASTAMPVIAGLIPNSGFLGRSPQVQIATSGTAFQSAMPTVDFADPGITVGKMAVNGDGNITLSVDISDAAKVGAHDVTITSGDLTDPLIFGLRREHDPVTWTDCSVPNYPSQERKQISD